MGRRVATSVRVSGPQGAVHVLAPGDEVPEWAVGQITNDAVYLPEDTARDEGPVTVEAASTVDGEGGEPFVEAAHDAGAPDYSAMKVAELRALADARGLPVEGTKAELVAALEAADHA